MSFTSQAQKIDRVNELSCFFFRPPNFFDHFQIIPLAKTIHTITIQYK